MPSMRVSRQDLLWQLWVMMQVCMVEHAVFLANKAFSAYF
jgi:hypothetical protein